MRSDATGVLVDARDYYAAIHQSLLSAQRYVLIAGWQFDSRVPLLRGPDAERADAPVRLLELLEHAVALRPALHLYLLAWDYSLVFALEREWLQRLKFDWRTSERIHFVFDNQVAAGASHHQKLVVVDGWLGFAGGIDLCDARWDDRAHALDNPERLTVTGKRQKPYHDVMVYCTGGAVGAMERVFRIRWERATGEALQLPEPAQSCEARFEGALGIDATELAVSLTYGEHAPSRTPKVEQIRVLFEDAIAAARRSIYVETQYFTSRALHAALDARMRSDGPKLDIVIMTPNNADTPKERLALGAAQDWVLSSLRATARAQGHALRMLFSATETATGELVTTFVHSKVVIVDDRFLSIGSANFTNRSMGVDSELNLSCESETPGDALSRSIARLRANLLSEHAGVEHDAQLEDVDKLVQRVDALIGRSKLRALEVPERPSLVTEEPLMERAFDPEKALTNLEWADLFEPR